MDGGAVMSTARIALLVTLGGLSAAAFSGCGGTSSDGIFSNDAGTADAASTGGSGGGTLGSGGSSASGGSSGSAGGGPMAVTLENVCDVTTPALCAAFEPCCMQGRFGFDRAACEATQRADCEQAVERVKNGVWMFDAAAVLECVDSLSEVFSGSCALGLADFPRIVRRVQQCDSVFFGTVGVGGACDQDEDCALPEDPDEFIGCDEDTNTCESVTLLSQGEPCSFDDFGGLCDEGLFCDIDFAGGATSGTCQPKTPSGQPCDTLDPFNLECGLGFFCDSGAAVCAPGLRGGEACDDDLLCESLSCAMNRCEPTDLLVDQQDCTG